MAAVWNAAHASDPVGFAQGLRSARQQAARRARRLLSRHAVVTLSYSSTVVAALGGRTVPVSVALSLPGGEGARTVRALRRRGTPATIIPDAAMAAHVARARAVVLGADAVTARGVINKVGSRLLALAARAERLPCYVVTDTGKFAAPPARFPEPRLPPDGLFERVELDLITRIVTERGLLTPRSVELLVSRGPGPWISARGIRLPPSSPPGTHARSRA
jgi:translation initiation factor 2B subunit (eIF-2B alpha/beta/delta family)